MLSCSICAPARIATQNARITVNLAEVMMSNVIIDLETADVWCAHRLEDLESNV